MPEKDAFADLRKAKEEEFFRKREQALIEKLRQRAAAGAEARKMGDALGAKDPRILEDLQALGFNADTVSLLYVVPLVAVAWADGGVSARERSLIEELAGVRGVPPDSPAGRQLRRWLDERPSAEFLDASLRVIGHLLRELPANAAAPSGGDLLSRCARIAEASGGILGLGAISPEERELIGRVAREIEQGHAAAARDVMERL
jgi:hypothetical protein